MVENTIDKIAQASAQDENDRGIGKADVKLILGKGRVQLFADD